MDKTLFQHRGERLRMKEIKFANGNKITSKKGDKVKGYGTDNLWIGVDYAKGKDETFINGKKVEDKLNNSISIIKYKERSIIINFLSIGSELCLVQESMLWKQLYPTYEAFIDQNFSFSYRQALKFMKVSKTFPNSGDVVSKLGLEKLYLLTYVPESEVKELVQETIEDDYTVKDLNKRIKRFHSEPIKENTEDEELRVQRQGAILLSEIEEFNRQTEETLELLRLKAKDFINNNPDLSVSKKIKGALK